MCRSLLLLALAGVLVTLCSFAVAKGKRSVAQEDTRYEESTGKRGLAGVEPGRYFEANETIEPGPSRVAKAPACPPGNATLPGAAPGAAPGASVPPAAPMAPVEQTPHPPATPSAPAPSAAPSAPGAVKAP